MRDALLMYVPFCRQKLLQAKKRSVRSCRPRKIHETCPASILQQVETRSRARNAQISPWKGTRTLHELDSRLESRLPNESTIYPLFCSCCLTPSFWTSGPRKKYWLSRWALPRKTLSSTLSWNWRRPGQSCPQSRGRHKDTTVISRCWGRSSHTFHSELGKRSDHSQFHHDLENYPCARFCTASAATMLRKSKGSCLLVRV